MNQVNLQRQKPSSWPWMLLNERSSQECSSTLTLGFLANALWQWLERWKKDSCQREGKPPAADALWQDIAAQTERLVVKVGHVDTYVSKSRGTEEHKNNQQVDQADRVIQIDLNQEHKGQSIPRLVHP